MRLQRAGEKELRRVRGEGLSTEGSMRATILSVVLGLLLSPAMSHGAGPKPATPAAPPTPATPPTPPTKLIVHEWGTFLGVQGSDGTTLGGMVASEELLPSFVEVRSHSTYDRTTLRSKMETPVTYFYVDRPMSVDVRVDMPGGILTHWFPMVAQFGPAVPAPGAPVARDAKNSFLHWSKVDLIPHKPNLAIEAGNLVPNLWRVKPNDHWRFAREVDAAFVKARSRNLMDWSEFDFEKFLFYRGLGTFELPLQVKSREIKGDVFLTLTNRDPQPLTGMVLLQVSGDQIRIGRLENLPGRAERELPLDGTLGQPLSLGEGAHHAMKHVAGVLMAAGLYEREAWAMVHSWEKSYFRTDGLRVLFILPRATTDAYIPIKITPKPTELVRVMVGRTEILTPTQERQIETWLGQLADPDFKVRNAASVNLAKLGRLGEPALRRVAAVSRSAEVRQRAHLLIQAAMKAD